MSCATETFLCSTTILFTSRKKQCACKRMYYNKVQQFKAHNMWPRKYSINKHCFLLVLSVCLYFNSRMWTIKLTWKFINQSCFNINITFFKYIPIAAWKWDRASASCPAANNFFPISSCFSTSAFIPHSAPSRKTKIVFWLSSVIIQKTYRNNMIHTISISTGAEMEIHIFPSKMSLWCKFNQSPSI